MKKTKIPKKGYNKNLKTRYTRNKSNTKKKSSFGFFKFFLYTVLFFLIIGFILILILYNKVLKELPDVNQLRDYNTPESTKIFAKDGEELYTIYKEKRTYVDFNEISPNMVNAIVAGEDKKFWTNPGFDAMGLLRAGLYFAMRKNESIGGTSTLTQQLIRNTIIEKKPNETMWEGIERKIKELYLSYQLTKQGISKEKILELYLNKIEYGHNAFGIEEASRTFFNKKSKDLTVMEASILASLPRGPSWYSPYNHQKRLVGNPYIVEGTEIKDILTPKDVTNNAEIIEKLKVSIKNLKGKSVDGSDIIPVCGIDKEVFGKEFNIDASGCTFINYDKLSELLRSIQIKFDGKIGRYNTGRKDYILRRMLEDGYITFDEYKDAVIGGIGIVFNQNREEIKAPHFVFYVKEYLEEKYGKDVVATGGLKVYTTLDYKAQKKAEELVKTQTEKNAKNFNAKNAALISIDNTNGDIISMVGSADYFNKDIDGNVNIIRSKLQPGSSFKPFVYALAMQKQKIGTNTPIYDLKTTFPGNYTPNNFDRRFMGKMNISTALNYSRNIPAIKMYYMAGGTQNILDFMKKLGVKSLKDKNDYGASLALGTGEITPFELAHAYSTFANLGEQVDINPIYKIVDSKGMIIEEKKDVKKKRVIDSGETFLINYIISDTSSRPGGWNKFLTIPGRKIAAKTGTATKPIKRNGSFEEYPSNLWTIGYTPQVTTVVWAGNTDGEALNMKGNGLEGAGPIWRDFMEYIHKDKKVLDWNTPKDIKKLSISSITGYLPNPEAPNKDYLVSSYFLNPPEKIDNSYNMVKYDALCNGVVTKDTPKAAIREAMVLEFHSLRPDDPAWENPVEKWAGTEEAIQKYGSQKGFLTTVKDEVCKRTESSGNIQIGSNFDDKIPHYVGQNYIEIGYRSSTPISKIEVLLNGTIFQTFPVNGKTQGVIKDQIFIPGRLGNSKVQLEIRAVDKNYYSGSENKTIIISGSTPTENSPISSGNSLPEFNEETEISNLNTSNNTSVPTITITNPANNRLKIYQKDYFNFRANIGGSNIKEVQVFVDGNLVKNLGASQNIVLPINQEPKYTIGIHSLKIEVTDSNGNSNEKSLNFEILAG